MMFCYPVSSWVSADADALVASFRQSRPVRHVVIDQFLDKDYVQELFTDLPDLTVMPKSRDYVFSDKRELSTLDMHSEISRKLHEVFMSTEMAEFASHLVGREVFIDPEYGGGGFHAGDTGSFLDLHVDFNIHPAHESWLRELNILLYLNPGWEPSWGGELLLTDHPENPGIEVEPLFNRLVIMECTDNSFHGYRSISFPPDHSRRSIAAYGYSKVAVGSVVRHTTNWAPEDPSLVKRVLAKNWNRIVLTKNRFFGSGTLKNRR
jgi:Rps23 Pro-64 3,4-dihydroxylase Tpa1-like proline 4-hydroxylase